MTKTGDIEDELEELRQTLPDPFEMPTKLGEFFDGPVAQRLIAGGEDTVRRLLAFLERCREPALARVAVLLLSRFPAADFYPRLPGILERSDQRTTEAFESGLWLIHLPERQIAQDLVRVAESSGNPNPLLLLQRPAAKEVRDELGEFIRRRKLPLSLYALYAYGYALEPGDIPLLKDVSEWVDTPQLSAPAGLYLLSLGSKDGLAGVRAGLMSPDEDLRTLTYYELGDYLSKTVIAEAGYRPSEPGDSQGAAVDKLIEHVASS